MAGGVEIDDLAKAIKEVLAEQAASICAHVDAQAEIRRSGGIEAIFAKPLLERLRGRGFKVATERPVEEIGSRTFFETRGRGQVDAVFEGDVRTAAEFKAVRLPRNKNDALFDLGQLTADYLRLSRASAIDQGYLVVFVYGGLVEDAASAASLWRSFHNQMFVEFEIAKLEGRLADRPDVLRAAHELDWSSVCAKAKIPTHGRAVAAGRIGAIIMECKR